MWNTMLETNFVHFFKIRIIRDATSLFLTNTIHCANGLWPLTLPSRPSDAYMRIYTHKFSVLIMVFRLISAISPWEVRQYFPIRYFQTLYSEWYLTALMINQHWYSLWLGVPKLQSVETLRYLPYLLTKRVSCIFPSTKPIHQYETHIVEIVSLTHICYNDVTMGAMASHITSLTIVYSTGYSRRRSKKTSKLCVTGLSEGNSPVTGEFPAQRASNAKDASIWWRHHVPSGYQSQIAVILVI